VSAGTYVDVGWALPTRIFGREPISNYRRIRTEGGTFFFTVVTYKRRPLFNSIDCVDMLRASISETRRIATFNIHAWVLLPDHMHCIWTLPEYDDDYSRRWGMIKACFTKKARHALSADLVSSSRKKHRESSVWQRRFWEHRIRDDRDFLMHTDYIHYNPVKHGYVVRVQDWPYSTFHRHVKRGVYPIDWAVDGIDGVEFGE
jgi:putative transposase